jgi:hypothetical protein
MATSEGFEPPTLAFEARCSIQLSYEAAEESKASAFGREISKIIGEGRENWARESKRAAQQKTPTGREMPAGVSLETTYSCSASPGF